MLEWSKEFFGILAAIFAFFISLSYIYSVVKWVTKPNLSAWVLYSFATAIIFLSSFSLGVRSTLWIIWVQLVVNITVALLTLRYGIIKWNKVDIICIIFSLLTIVLWYITNDSRIALYLNILLDALGSVSLIYKLYRNPWTESTYIWAFWIFITILNLLAVKTWSPENYLFPVYLFILNVSIFLLSFRKERK